MEIIIFIAVVVGAALLWNGYVKAKKADSDQTIDNWQPPKAEDKPWPYGEKLPEGKIHVKTTDVSGSENRVEATAPQCGCGRSPTGFCVGLHKLTAEEWAVSDQNPNKASVADVTADNKAAAVAKVKKAPAKKIADKKPAAKKAPAKKKST
jgi:hypothetical protein